MLDAVIVYEKATPVDSTLLTDIAYTSKKYWNYSDEQMTLWKEDLRISASYILSHLVYKIFHAEKLIGFYALKYNDAEACYEIDHLWLIPENINKGFGRIVFRNISRQLSFSLKQTRCILIAEPNAEGFYKKMNGKAIRSFESKISGRMLDVYEFNLT